MLINYKIKTVFFIIIAVILLIHSPLLAQTSWDGYTLSSQDQVTQDRFRADWPNYPGGGDGRWIFERNKYLETLGWIGPNSGPIGTSRPGTGAGSILTPSAQTPMQIYIQKLKVKYKEYLDDKKLNKVDEVYAKKIKSVPLKGVFIDNITEPIVEVDKWIAFLYTRLAPANWDIPVERNKAITECATDLFASDYTKMASFVNGLDKAYVVSNCAARGADPGAVSRAFDIVVAETNKRAGL